MCYFRNKHQQTSGYVTGCSDDVIMTSSGAVRAEECDLRPQGTNRKRYEKEVMQWMRKLQLTDEERFCV